jgi:hypothetical protein
MAILRDLNDYFYWDNGRDMPVPYYRNKEILPSWIGFSNQDPAVNNGVFTIPAAAGGVAASTFFTQPYASLEGLDQNLGTVFEALSLIFSDSTDGTGAAAWTVLLTELGEVRQLMNFPCHIRTIAGITPFPAMLREPLVIPSLHTISARFQKLAGGAVNVRMNFKGRQYFPWSPEFLRYRSEHEGLKKRIKALLQRRTTIAPFWLTTDGPMVLGPGAAADFLLKPGNDAQFEAFALAAVSTGAFAWSLEDAKTLQTLMNGQVTSVNATGNAQFPTIFSTPYVLPADKRFRLRVLDLSAAPNTIWFTLWGRKIYAPFMEMRDAMADLSVPTMADQQTLLVPAPME